MIKEYLEQFQCKSDVDTMYYLLDNVDINYKNLITFSLDQPVSEVEIPDDVANLPPDYLFKLGSLDIRKNV